MINFYYPQDLLINKMSDTEKQTDIPKEEEHK